MRNSNPFIFKARKNIAWVGGKQAINFRLEPHQNSFLNTAQSALSGPKLSQVTQQERQELFLTASVNPQAPRGSSHLFQIQLKLSRVPVLGSDKEVENLW